MLQVLKPSNPLRRVCGHGWVVATAYPGRARLRLTGCREPSPGPKRAGSWPFGLPSSRLRPCRAARSACIAPGQAVLGICNVRHRGIAVGPGDATAAIRICARLRKSPCSCPPPGQEAARPVDNCTARSGLCWASLAGRCCVRWPLHRNAFGDQRGAPLGSADQGKATHPHSPGGSSSSVGSGRPNGLSAAVPCLQRAFAAYPRSQAPSGIPRPIARGPALDSPGLPRPTDADEQTTTGSALQGEGSCGVRCANALKSVCLPLATLSLGAVQESGCVKSKGQFLARENRNI